MTAQSVAALGAAHDTRWWLSWIGRAAAIALVCLGLYLTREWLGRPAATPGLQRVRLLNPSPPPPPPRPPEEKPKEEPKPEEIVETADIPRSDEPAPVDDRLGLDADAEGAGDGFGLVAKPGGRAVITLGNSGTGGRGAAPASGFSRYMEDGYNRTLGTRLEYYLNQREDLRNRRFRSTIDLWISPAGTITRAQFITTEQQEGLEDLLRRALLEMPALNAPPAGYRQPVRVVVRASREGRD